MYLPSVKTNPNAVMHGVQMPWAVPLFLKREAQVEHDVRFESAPQLPQSEASLVPVGPTDADMVYKSKLEKGREPEVV